MYYLKFYNYNAKIFVSQLNKISNIANKYFKIFLQDGQKQSALCEKINQ